MLSIAIFVLSAAVVVIVGMSAIWRGITAVFGASASAPAPTAALAAQSAIFTHTIPLEWIEEAALAVATIFRLSPAVSRSEIIGLLSVLPCASNMDDFVRSAIDAVAAEHGAPRERRKA